MEGNCINNNAFCTMHQPQQPRESIPNDVTDTRSSAVEFPAIPAVKVTSEQEMVTSQSAARDHVEASSAVDDVTSSRDESIRPNRAQQQQQPRPSKAERILGLTSRDFESAATEARRRGDDGSRRAPPPSNLELRPPGSAGGSPRSVRRQGPDASSTGSPSSPLDPAAASRKHCPQKTKSKMGGLQLPVVDHRGRGFAPAMASSSNTDLKVVGNGSEADSDVDLSSVADDGSSTSSGANFAPKKSSEHRGRDRFKKILKPGTRSKSAGASGERAPAYALFLRHQKPPTVIRSTDDVMRNSAENTDSDEETTDGGTGTSGKLPGGSKQKKDRFSFFRRGEGHSGHTYSNALLPSSETLQGWTRSFEKLLTDKYGVKLFREFLRREFSDENVEFWIECEKYRHLTSEKQRIAESKKIFREFVAVQAPNEINLDSKTRETTETNLCRAEPRLFEAAQKRIEALMEKDSYPRFLQSDVFQRLLQQRQAADHSLRVT